MSAMSIFITRTMLNSFIEQTHRNPARIFLLNFAFAQGSAFLVTLVTIIMDNHGNPDTSVLPNIGDYSCWFGSPHYLDVPFYKTPQFLYFYMIIILIMVINVSCFILTGVSLISHWWQMRGLAQGSINELFKTQLITVAKLFFIMGKN